MSKEKIKILLIEDDLALRTVYSKAFSTGPFQVVGEAANGQDGVALFEQLHPDVTLCDISMPVMDGMKALQTMLASNPQACIIMLTAVNIPDVWQDCIAMGAKYYLLKGTSYPKAVNVVLETWQEHQKMLGL